MEVCGRVLGLDDLAVENWNLELPLEEKSKLFWVFVSFGIVLETLFVVLFRALPNSVDVRISDDESCAESIPMVGFFGEGSPRRGEKSWLGENIVWKRRIVLLFPLRLMQSYQGDIMFVNLLIQKALLSIVSLIAET